MTLHWLSAVAVLIAFILGPGDFGRITHAGVDPGTRSDILWHETLGLFVFVITVVRLLWLALRPTPPDHQLPTWIDNASRWVKGALWVLLIVTPIVALMTLAGESQPLTLVGGLRADTLPLLSGWGLTKQFDWGQVHSLLGDVIIWLAGLHTAAALFHHFIRRDNVLRAMLPGRTH